jgi:N-acetylglutamate synthase-like GNAT family acetyltransferase
MPSLTLRRARAADWTAVDTLLTSNGLPVDGAREHLSTFVLAQAGDEIVGCAGLEPRGDVALLRSVAVAAGRRRQGIGRQMVGSLLDEARRRGFTAVALLTTTARRYFEALGFGPADRSAAPAALRRSAEFQGACPDGADFLLLPLHRARPAGLDPLPVAVLGAGPVGLAAVAQLIDRGIPFVILEAATRVGANLIDYGHVRLFTPWRYAIDTTMAGMLGPTGWQAPAPDELPLAREIVERVLEPFARLPRVASALNLATRVVAVARDGVDKVKSAGRDTAPLLVRAIHQGEVVEYRARAVIDATGTWSTPNPVGASGLPAIGERAAADRIAYGIPDVLGVDRSRYAGKRTLVVGAGHSAANVLLYLADLARQVPATTRVWAVRSPDLARVFGGGDADALPARGALGSALRAQRDSGDLEVRAGLRITRIERRRDTLDVVGIDADAREHRLEAIDEIICATGQRPDLSITRELRVKLDPSLESTEALGPLIDPNLHSCGTVRPHGHRELGHPEPGLFTVGVKSYGRAPTFLMATGFEQVRSVVAAIAGDLEAADRVELDLPETGVCSVGGSAIEGVVAAACCGAEPSAATAVAAPGVAATSSTGRGAATRGTATPAGAPVAEAATGCCGGPPKADVSACCALDERKKAEGASGCGCGTTVPAGREPARAGKGCR